MESRMATRNQGKVKAPTKNCGAAGCSHQAKKTTPKKIPTVGVKRKAAKDNQQAKKDLSDKNKKKKRRKVSLAEMSDDELRNEDGEDETDSEDEPLLEKKSKK